MNPAVPGESWGAALQGDGWIRCRLSCGHVASISYLSVLTSLVQGCFLNGYYLAFLVEQCGVLLVGSV